MEVGNGAPPTVAEKEQERKSQEKIKQEAYDFDPDASPEDKAAQMKKAIPPGLVLNTVKLNEPPKASGVTTAIDGPTVNGNGITNGQTNGKAERKSPVSPKSPISPVMINGFPKAGEDDWSRTSGPPRIGNVIEELMPTAGDTSEHQTWVAGNLDDRFYGEWWHNAGVIIFACLTTWFITKIGGGFAWVILVMATCGTYYRTSIMRVRRNVRDDLNREFAKQRLESDVESLEWMNAFLTKFWPIYIPVLEASIMNTVDGILAANCPGFLDSIRLPTFHLGSKPFRLDHVKTYLKTEDDTVEMDWKFSFTPKDVSDMTSKQIKDKVNPKIVLEARIGQGIVSKGIPIIVEDMQFSGLMKFKIKLQVPFPHIEKVDVCFLEKPSVDFVLKPLGGDTFGFDIGFLPGLSGFIQEQVHGNLGPMFYAPHIFTVEVAKMLGGAPVDQSIGVVQLTIHHAQGLKNSDKFNSTTDPYVICSIDGGKELARTKTIHENDNPRWNETKYIILTTFNGNLDLDIFDFNDFRKDASIGKATFDMKQLEENPEHENVTLPIMIGPKQKGQIICDFRFFPVLEETKLEDGTTQPPPDLPTGILRYTVSQAKDLDSSKSMIGQLSPYAIMSVNNKDIHTTAIKKRKNSPIWEEFEEVLITNRSKCTLGLKIKDDRGLAADPELGIWNMKLDLLMKDLAKGNEWFNLANAKCGKVKLRAQWKPVALKGAVGSGYVTPIGVMRIHFKNAKDLRNLEAVGKSDPYGRVLLNGIEKAKTVVFNNELNPKWDEVLYVPVHNAREMLTLEVMDAEKMGSDRSLGAFDLAVAEYIKEDEETGQLLEHSPVEQSRGLVLNRKGTAKGTLNFTVAFYPCLNIADPEEEDEEKAQESRDTEKEKSPELEAPESAGMRREDSVASAVSADEEVEKSKKVPKLRLTPEKLLEYNSGLLIFRFIEGEIAKTDTHLDILMDDMMYPAYSTAKIKSHHQKFEEIGDCVIRELDFSKVTIRLRESRKDKEHEDNIIAKLTGDTILTLKKCLNNPAVLTLNHNGDHSTVKISLKYIPIQMTLDPSESINNMGNLRVDLLDAANLPAMDRNGKSDPFCVFELNDKEVFKSKVIKRTLHPAWNEFFDTRVPSRTAADFIVKVYDQDFAGNADFIGQAKLDLTGLQPYTPFTQTYKLFGKKWVAGDFGVIRLRLLFTAAYVTRTRQGSSTFSGTFAVPGKIVTNVPLKVGGTVVGGISAVKRSLFRGKSKTNDIVEEEQSMEQAVAQGGGVRVTGDGDLQTVDSHNQPTAALDKLTENNMEQEQDANPRTSLAPNDTRHHRRSKSVASIKSNSTSRPDTSGSGAESGVASIRLVSASGFGTKDLNMRGRIRVVGVGGKTREILKSKSHKTSTGEVTWDEICTTTCTADQQFKIYLEDDHLFKDQPLGETIFHVDNTGNGKDTIVAVGVGQVVLRTSFRPNGTSENGAGGSPKRKGFLGKK